MLRKSLAGVATVLAVLIGSAFLGSSRPASVPKTSNVALIGEKDAPVPLPSTGDAVTANPFAPQEQRNISYQGAAPAAPISMTGTRNLADPLPGAAAQGAATPVQLTQPSAADDFGDCLSCAKDDTNHPEIVRIFVTTTAGTLWYQGGGDFFILSHFLARNLETLSTAGSISEKPTYALTVVMRDGRRRHVDIGDSWIASEGLIGLADSALVAKLESSTLARRGQEMTADRAKEVVR